MSAISSSTATTYSAMASILPRASKPCVTRRRLHLACGKRTDQRQALARFRRSRRTGGKEHRPRGGGVWTCRQRYQSPSGRGCIGCARTAANIGGPSRRAGDPLLSNQRRPATGICQDGQRPLHRQDRQLDDPPQMRFRESDLEASLPRIVA